MEEDDILYESIEVLAEAAELFLIRIGKPLYIAEKGKERFRCPRKDIETIQALKAARIVSAFRACKVLLEAGYVQEIGVLLRTIDDFISEIEFLEEGRRSSKLNKSQELFLQQFFRDDLKSTEELHADDLYEQRITRQKIRAAQARFAQGFENPDTSRRRLRVINFTWSSYVHGEYPAIMELYGGQKGWHLAGMKDSPKPAAYRQYILMMVYSALLTFGLMALSMNLKPSAISLAQQGEKIRNSPDYQIEVSDI